MPAKPESMLIIGGGPIGLEFGYFYNAIGTKVTVVELLDRIFPGEDEEVSAALEKSLTKRGLTILTRTKTTKIEKTATGVKAEVETPRGKQTIEAEHAAGRDRGARQCRRDSSADELKLEIVKNHIKADPKNGYVTSVPGIYAVGDVIGPPWLAHVAHSRGDLLHRASLWICRSCDRLHEHPRLHLHRPGRGERRA